MKSTPGESPSGIGFAPRRAGQFRPESAMRVRMNDGHRTDTPTGAPRHHELVEERLGEARRPRASWPRRGPSSARRRRPASDAVLTTWPSFCSTSRGTNARMPCTTPMRLTLDGPFPALGRDLPRPTEAAAHAGVVAHDVGGAEVVERRRGEGLHLPASADVALDADRRRRRRASSSATASPSGSGSTSASAIPMPAPANASASARPMPLAPPVIAATLPSRSCMVRSFAPRRAGPIAGSGTLPARRRRAAS